MYHTWNSCRSLKGFARASFDTLEQAKAHRTPAGGPNRIMADDGRQWVLGAYPDHPPQWFETSPDWDTQHPARPTVAQ